MPVCWDICDKMLTPVMCLGCSIRQNFFNSERAFFLIDLLKTNHEKNFCLIPFIFVWNVVYVKTTLFRGDLIIKLISKKMRKEIIVSYMTLPFTKPRPMLVFEFLKLIKVKSFERYYIVYRHQNSWGKRLWSFLRL